jgi:uncharacterized protein
VFINIEELKPESVRVRHVYQAGEIPFVHEDAVLAKSVSTDFVLTHENREVWIDGNLDTAIRYKCSRCVREFARDVSANFDLHYVPQPKWSGTEEIELKYEEMEVGYYDGVAIDIDLVILEQIELAMPMKFVCREDCKGLCPNCGADLNEAKCGCVVEESRSRMADLLNFPTRTDKR